MLDKIKKLFSRKSTQQGVRYIIYKYDLNRRTGKWRWRRMVELDKYVEATHIEDFPEDGYYQLREVSPNGVHARWTVLVENGEVAEYDPELPSNIPITTPQQTDPMRSLEQAIQYLKMQKQILEDLGMIKDPKKEMLETITMLKELEEIKKTASSILQPTVKANMDDAPWWAVMAMQMLPAMASLSTQMTQPQYPQYPQSPQYPQYPQYPQPQPQQEEHPEITFEPPSVDDIKKTRIVRKARKKIEQQINEELESIAPGPEPKQEQKEQETKPKLKVKEDTIDKEIVDIGNSLLEDVDEVE